MISGKRLPCGHVLHLFCLQQWVCQQQACPLCHQELGLNENSNNFVPNRRQPQVPPQQPQNEENQQEQENNGNLEGLNRMIFNNININAADNQQENIHQPVDAAEEVDTNTEEQDLFKSKKC